MMAMPMAMASNPMKGALAAGVKIIAYSSDVAVLRSGYGEAVRRLRVGDSAGV